MNLRNYMVAGIIALGTLVGCKNEPQVEVVQGIETVLQKGDNFKLFSDINGEGNVDLYCHGSTKTDLLQDKKALEWEKGECFYSLNYNISDKPFYKSSLHPTKGILSFHLMRPMDERFQARVNAEYNKLNNYNHFKN